MVAPKAVLKAGHSVALKECLSAVRMAAPWVERWAAVKAQRWAAEWAVCWVAQWAASTVVKTADS
jgi:hypothetical protein